MTKPIGNLKTIGIALIIASMTFGIFATFGINRAHAGPPTFIRDNGDNSVTVATPYGIKMINIYSSSVHDTAPGCVNQFTYNFPKGKATTYPLLIYVLDCAATIKGHTGVFMSVFKAKPLTPTNGPLREIQNTGPGTGTILIHEFLDDTIEATAFGSGALDFMDWPPASTFVNQWTQPGGIVQTGAAGLSKFGDTGMFQIDINSWNEPTNDKDLRQAFGYLVDRQQIVNAFAGGLAVPICAGTFSGQPGAKSCLQLGYPTSFGELNPTKALQVLYESGWRDCGDGSLALPGKCSGGTGPTLIFYVRLDDGIRRQAGDQLTNALGHLPNHFTAKTGGNVVVCVAANCKINVNEQVLPRSSIAPIVFRASGSKAWNIYTGGWGLGFDPDHLFDLYTSGDAWSTCGGGWAPNVGALNYPCNVDATYDALAQPLKTGATYADVLNAAAATQAYGWGYTGSGPTGKISGTMPTVPMYTRQAEAAYRNHDVGSSPVISPGCWKGWLGQEVGSGLGETTVNTGSAYLYNCSDQKPGYASYRGGGIMDWGFKSDIQAMNIVTSEWLWDILAMQQTYDTCLGRNPTNLGQIVQSMCENFGQSTVFNTALNKQTTVATYKFQNGIMWSDGVFATANDMKFSIEYVLKNVGFNQPLVSDYYSSTVVEDHGAGQPVTVCEPKTVCDFNNGFGYKLVVYFDDIGALFMQNAGFMPIIAKHVWCPDYDGTPAHDVGPAVAARAGCPYPHPDLFPDFDFSKHVGTGPYIITGCTGTGCTSTITLKPNPYYTRSTAFFNMADGVQVQPDVNRDDQVNQADLDIVNDLVQTGAQIPWLDVDYRMNLAKKTETLVNAVGPGSFTVTETGPHTDATDRYIVQRLIDEAVLRGLPSSGIIWPPGLIMTYNWPDADRDNDVDLDDLTGVFIKQFQNPAIPANGLKDVTYDASIDLSDLITTFVRQFTRPAGSP